MSLKVELLEANGFDYSYGDVILQHAHSGYFQLYYIVRGNCTLLYKSEKKALNANEFVLIAPREEHCMLPLKSPYCTMLDLKFTIPDSVFESVLKQHSGIHTVGSFFLQQLFTMIWNEAYERADNYNAIIRRALEIIFLNITRSRDTSSDSPYNSLSSFVIENHNQEQFEKLSHCTQRTLKYIEGTVLENTSFSLENTAKVLAYNKTYMCRCFSNEIGISITQYRTLLRIDKAKELLRTTKSDIAALGRHLGYDDVTSFIKAFKQNVGMTPSEYRKSNPKSGDHGFRYSFRSIQEHNE